MTQQPELLASSANSFGQFLLDRGVLSAAELLRVRGERIGGGQSLLSTLLHLYPERIDVLLDHAAQWHRIPYRPTLDLSLDHARLSQLPFPDWLDLRAAPLVDEKGATFLAITDPDCLSDGRLTEGSFEGFADITPILTRRSSVFLLLEGEAAKTLGPLASMRTADQYSFRKDRRQKQCWAWGAIAMVALACTCATLWPQGTLTALSIWASVTLALGTIVKLAILATLPAQRSCARPKDSKLRPRISVLVPLFKEPEIARLLQQRLSRLRYPAGALEILLLLEETDHLTQKALADVALPPDTRILIVPEGQPQTKPRAMNYALDFCSGEIVGIYDAEDAPDPDQLLHVAAAFADAPEDLACVQGALDYYNPRQSWLARCFTIEYATWFRLILPGLRRLGFAIPLGGTTLFCRRDVLKEVGGWDAYNVTEDADLGIRLARFGYRCELLPSTTMEEANCRLLPWIRQRSRWLKGYMVTYLVHMRRPIRLFQDLGWWQFLGLQLHFVTTLSQVLLAPLLWSYWAMLFAGVHPLMHSVSEGTLAALGLAFVFAELVVLAAAAIAVSAPDHRHLIPWVVSTHFYFPLAALGAYKALFELIFQPSYWDKTQHGFSIHASAVEKASQPPVAHRIKLQTGGESL